MLNLVDVCKSFNETPVLQPTTLSLEPGKTVVLIGPSGCGKSTLLRMLVGLIMPDAGTIEFGGELLTSQNILRLRHRMGYVLQDGGLFPHLTVKDNVALMARYLNTLSGSALDKRITDLADLTKLPSTALDRYPTQISGGQRQRVAIMRALILDPPLMLLDEPMGALDPLVRYDLQADLQNIFVSLKKTVVIVTHDMGEAGFFGDDVILMAGGRIVQRGAIEDFYSHPAEEFVTRFITAQRAPNSRKLPT
ncbi:MAG: ATP-binding cassette domain-containing protein [Pirellulaceae bacterium]|nr:ATP-binding cassette domain-containing protein [Pirellulaceae bacterium]